MVRFKFPQSFLWGSAVASYQVEGNIENNDWARAGHAGMVPKAGMACDFVHTFEEDLDRAVMMGQNAFRFSIEWSRVEPSEGHFDESVLSEYKALIKAIKRKKMQPIMTIWHFTLPTWFADKGGFEKTENIFDFIMYARRVVEYLRDDLSLIITMNEPMVYTSNGYIRGNWPPFKKTWFKHFKVLKNLILAHNETYNILKASFPELEIGYSKNNIWFHSSSLWGTLPVSVMNWFWNDRFVHGARGHADFIGLNYYFHKAFGQYEKLPKNDFGWDICPQGLYECIMRLNAEALPIYITENGTADQDDNHRGQFILDHIREVARAMLSGAQVKGYLHWSLLDNFEWAVGYEKRFGLIEVNFSTQERKIRQSASVYENIIRNGTFEI